MAKKKTALDVEAVTPVETAASPFDELTIGRIVHFVIPDGPSAGQCRPAIVVRVRTDLESEAKTGVVNLDVFLDDLPDRIHMSGHETPRPVIWVTSVAYSAEPKRRTWHWPEQE